MKLAKTNMRMGALVRPGGPTAGNEGSTEACGPTERRTLVEKRVCTPTAEMLVSPLQRAQARCLAAAERLTGAARWRVMK